MIKLIGVVLKHMLFHFKPKLTRHRIMKKISKSLHRILKKKSTASLKGTASCKYLLFSLVYIPDRKYFFNKTLKLCWTLSVTKTNSSHVWRIRDNSSHEMKNMCEYITLIQRICHTFVIYVWDHPYPYWNKNFLSYGTQTKKG